MNSWNQNLPPGCSSSEIERRGDPDVDANDFTVEDDILAVDIKEELIQQPPKPKNPEP